MRYVVLEEFKTTIHHFRPGDEVDDMEVDGPLTAIEWADLGKLGSVAPADEDLDALRVEARELGLPVDMRWGAKRLRDAIEAVKADLQADAHAAEESEAEAAAEAAAETKKKADKS